MTLIKKIPSKEKAVEIVLIVLLLALLIFANWQFAKQNEAGVDFLIRWLPTRMVLFEGFESPYSDEATNRVELFQYGHSASGEDVTGHFLYPHYFMLFTLPFALVKNFTTARVLWMTLLEVSQIAIIFLSLKIVNFKPKKSTLLLLLFISLLSTYFVQPIIDGNPSSLSALFVILCLFFLSKEKDWLAGFFLAFSTLKPQMVILFCVLVWWWAFSNKRWKVMASSAIGVSVLMGSSFLFHPGWFTEFIGQLMIYQDITSLHSPATILSVYFPVSGAAIGFILNILCIALLIFAWVRLHKKGFQPFLWTVCITFALLPLTSIAFGNRNLVVLLPAIVLIVATLHKHFPQKSIWWDLSLIVLLLYSWFALFLPESSQAIPDFFSFKNYLPFAALIAILLYVFRSKMIPSLDSPSQ
ncbi:MAG: DUF2029 domain-containing protein [Anaerolineaceae bacterium]|nr:DUF2029 domain-containing protein [Anaerolineaceae bacterium]